MKKNRDIELQLGISHVRLHIILVWLFSSILSIVGLLGVSADRHVPVVLVVITAVATLSIIIINTPILRKQMRKIGERLLED